MNQAKSMKKDYSELLRDPRWQKCRLEILQRDEFLCSLCQDGTTELHVHHKFYIAGLKPWEYESAMLTTLCKTCHSKVEALKQNLACRMTFEPTFGALAQIDEMFHSNRWLEVVNVINHLYEHPSQILPLNEFLASTTLQPEPDNETLEPAGN